MIVSDTGPARNLVLVGLDDLLPLFYGVVRVPRAVFDELRASGAPGEVRQWALSPPPWAVIETHGTETGRGAGEREARALATALNLPLLTDDLGARSHARNEGIRVVGTLRILMRAHAIGRIEMESVLDALRRGGFRISPGLADSSVHEAHRLRVEYGEKNGTG